MVMYSVLLYTGRQARRAHTFLGREFPSSATTTENCLLCARTFFKYHTPKPLFRTRAESTEFQRQIKASETTSETVSHRVPWLTISFRLRTDRLFYRMTEDLLYSSVIFKLNLLAFIF